MLSPRRNVRLDSAIHVISGREPRGLGVIRELWHLFFSFSLCLSGASSCETLSNAKSIVSCEMIYGDFSLHAR